MKIQLFVIRRNMPHFKVLLLAAICSVLLFGQTFADITIRNGVWSTSFEDCIAGVTYQGFGCDGVNVEDDYNISGVYSRIRNIEDDATGQSGKIFSTYFEGSSRNSISAPLTIRFQTPQKEFWLRFYYRLPSGQHVSSIHEHKIIYAFTDSAVAANVNWPGQGDEITLQPRNTMGTPDLYYGTDGGWADVYGNVSAQADGSWHCFEFHLDLGTRDDNNGIFEMWVDGTNHARDTNLDWFSEGTSSPSGWEHIEIPSNHNVFALSGSNPHDVDYFVVATSSYSGLVHDTNGNRMIGTAFDAGGGSSSSPSAPINLRLVRYKTGNGSGQI